MTKKSLIITTSIIVSVIALLGILFGAVFCLRTIEVKVTDGTTISVSNEDIETTSGFKKGSSIFMLNKTEATNKLESTYPELKVVQIKTVSVVRVEICVRQRQKMFYASYGDKFYKLDEELKVLDVVENEPTDLIYINSTELGITGGTQVGNFIGTAENRTATYNLYTSMHNTVVIDKGEESEHYADRSDVKDLISKISYASEFTADGQEYFKLVVKTKAGVIIEIIDPLHNCEDKVNGCFVEYFALENKSTGTIKALANGTFKFVE